MGGRLVGPSGRYELGAAVVSIGRSPANCIVVNDALVSAHHAEVWPEGSSYVLVDLGSTNGTLLNGQRLQPQVPYPLHTGSVITLGSTHLTAEVAQVELPPTVVARPPVEPPYAPTARAITPPGRSEDASAPGGLSPPGTTPEPTPSNPYGWTQPALASYYSDPLVPPPPPVYSPPPPDLLTAGTTGTRPSTRRRRLLLLAGGAVLALIFIIVAVFGVRSYISAHSPEGVTSSYYADLQGQSYQDAYEYLDSRAQRIFDDAAARAGLIDGQELFMNSYACLDRQLGEVLSFSASVVSATDTLARVQVLVNRAEIGAYTEEVRLIRENGAWKLDDVTFLLRGANTCFTRPQTPGSP
jgi:hypothetical protein